MDPLTKEPIDSPTGWVKEHIDRYVATDGKEGHVVQGATALLLTVVGRKSGKSYRTALYYGVDGDNYIVVASKGGAPEHPEWYRNLVAHPEVEVQVLADRFRAIARTATDEEQPALWKLMTAVWPPYDEYQQKTDRHIPVVILERIKA